MRKFLIAAALLGVAQPAMAATWVLRAEGAIDRVTGTLGADLVSVGDTLRFELRFDTGAALRAGPFYSAPGDSRYAVNGATATVTAGKLARTLATGVGPLTVILLNDWVTDGPRYDSQDFTLFRAEQGARPFGLADGSYGEILTFSANDYTGAARTNTSLADLASSSDAYGHNMIGYDFFAGFIPSEGSLQVRSFSARWTLTPAAVPEPASWALLIGGLGLTGAALRRRGGVAAAA